MNSAIFERSLVNKIMSPYEQYRYDHKLSELKEFWQFIAYMKEILVHVSQQRVSIDFDTYFFGTDSNNVSIIDYKLIDLDHITKDENCPDLYAINVLEFKRAINGFIRNLVVAAEQNAISTKLKMGDEDGLSIIQDGR